MKRIRKIDDNVFRLIIILITFLLIAGITKGGTFMKPSIFQTMGKQLAEYGLMSIGCGICMISGGIDLSCVYIANLCGIIAGLSMQKSGSSIIVAILISLLVGAACGAFNGFLVSYLRIPAMLATLGSYQLFQGISVVLSGGSSVSGIPDTYTSLGTLTIIGIPFAFIMFLLVVLIMTFIMSKTTFGTKVYLVGTNAKCAIFAGIKNNTIIIKTYMLSGLIAAVAGLLSLARINSAKADFGTSYTMQCILIAVLGGVNPNGGFGSIPGIAIAVLILQMLSSYLNTFPDISNYYRDLIWGVALIGVLIINFVINKKKTARLAKMS
ncbi:MAG: ABC transporter permease [Lachnospiraceae bacterium]|nr:ABC transporter permease [Lachnospiraceae bacterium]MDD3660519.1 ABC transporter permease [Lachnospiraceae bacterium]